LLAAAPSARAGTYDVWGCKLPDGRPTEVDGWRSWIQAEEITQNNCADGTGFSSILRQEAIGNWAETAWLFSAPDGTEIDNFTLTRAVNANGDREYHLYRLFSLGSQWPIPWTFSECRAWSSPCLPFESQPNQPDDPRNVVTGSGLTGTLGLAPHLKCRSRSGMNCVAEAGDVTPAYVQVWSSRIGLKDVLDPVFTKPPTGPCSPASPSPTSST
jgi:hypothetical protein